MLGHFFWKMEKILKINFLYDKMDVIFEISKKNKCKLMSFSKMYEQFDDIFFDTIVSKDGGILVKFHWIRPWSKKAECLRWFARNEICFDFEKRFISQL